jgi:hypothetical protein
MQIIINNEANLDIFRLHALLGEYLMRVHPDDNGENIYPVWINRDGIMVRNTEDGVMVEVAR